MPYETSANNTAYNQFMGCYLFSDPEEERNLSMIYSCLQMSRRGFALDLALDMQEGQQTVFLSPTSCKCVCLLQPGTINERSRIATTCTVSPL